MTIQKRLLIAVIGAASFPMLVQAEDVLTPLPAITDADVGDEPEAAPEPIVWGGFEYLPQAQFSAGSQSNVFAANGGEVSDTFVGFTPSLAVESVWARHELGGSLVIDHREFSDLADESRTDLNLKLRGRLDFSDQTSVSVLVQAADLTEDRTELSNSVFALDPAVEPNEYTQTGAVVRFDHKTDRLGVSAQIGIEAFDYDDAELTSGLFQDQDFRDRDDLKGAVRVAYDMNERTTVFADISYIYGEYDDPNFFDIFNRDVSGTTLLFGTAFDMENRLRGEVALGYLNYTYDDPAFETIQELAFDGELELQLSENTVLSASGSRGVMDPGLAIINAAVETRGQVAIEQRVTPKLDLEAGIGVAQYDLQALDQTHDELDLMLGANWRLNPNIWLEGTYEIVDASSTLQNYTDNRALLRMRIFP